ncbi:ABC transporter substrate-binding protein [Arthrobacter sp. GMC3]|uniref:ABC transporter substrate-binding protein n=1 Tax=Arthrobacter sp. GMC3 TaxID=2058894 RepID=UPI000CE503B9|nr:ABC transporter substrate-binding protein [Arthrobacter sp. GMC3]
MKARSSSAIGLAIVSTLFLAACGGPAAPAANSAPEYVKDGTLALALPEDPGDLNPVLTNKVAAQVVGSFAYDSLIATDPDTGKVQPYMASAWTETPSKVTFTLKDGITCADGTAFTAQMAADNYSWIVDPANGSPLKGSIIPADAKASAAGNVVTVETPEASPFLLQNIGSQAMACDAALKNPKSVSSASNGTGLFTVKEVVPNDHITLERRAGYTWGPDGATTSDTLGVPKTVTLKIVPNASTAANLLLSKGLNVAGISGPDEDRVKSAKLSSKPSTRLAGQLNFNHFAGLPTADPEVRKALVAAVDLDTYTKIVTAGTGVRATSLMALEPKVCVYDSVKGMLPAFDVKKAESILTAAGWSKNSAGVMEKAGKPLALSLYYINSTDRLSAAAEYLGSQWKALGVQVKLQGGDPNFVITNTFSTQDPSKWDVSTLTLQSNAPSIFPAYMSGEAPPKGTNFMSLNNSKYQDLTGQARVASGDAACELWKQAEQALFQDVDTLPVAVALSQTFFNGAESIYHTGTLSVPGSGYRVTK